MQGTRYTTGDRVMIDCSVGLEANPVWAHLVSKVGTVDLVYGNQMGGGYAQRCLVRWSDRGQDAHFFDASMLRPAPTARRDILTEQADALVEALTTAHARAESNLEHIRLSRLIRCAKGRLARRLCLCWPCGWPPCKSSECPRAATK